MEHSSAFLLQKRHGSSAQSQTGLDAERGEDRGGASSSTGSSMSTYQSRKASASRDDETPFEELVRRMDEGLDEMELNPPAYARAWHSLSTGPLGEQA